MSRSARAALVVLLGVLLLTGVWAFPPSASATTCRATSIGPRSLVVGLRPVTVRLRVHASCSTRGWLVEGRGFTADSGRPATRVSPSRLTNRSAGSSDAVVTIVVGRSKVVTTTVRDAITISRASMWSAVRASSRHVSAGRKTTLRATLRAADWDRHAMLPLAGRPVLLQVQRPSGRYETVRRLHTDASGAASSTVVARTTVRWRFVAPPLAGIDAAVAAPMAVVVR